MERIPQRNAIHIAYYDNDGFREIAPPIDIPRFLDFEYQYDLDVTEDMQGLNSTYMESWIRDVNDVKVGRYDYPEIGYPFTHFTKLVYMYVELLADQHYKYPIFFSPHGHAINGGSRMLIQTQYFSHLKWDAVRFKFNDRASNTIDPLVKAILKNRYWTNAGGQYPEFENRIRVLLEKEKIQPDADEYFYSMCDICFTRQPLFIFGKDWSVGADYVESFDYSRMVDKITRTTKLWENIRSVIKTHPIDTKQDYKTLLDKVVFDNVDFVRQWQEDFLYS